ncbi:MAG: hypothetical protein ACYDAY_11505 [Candidatus Dormibacteria bacterium]
MDVELTDQQRGMLNQLRCGTCGNWHLHLQLCPFVKSQTLHVDQDKKTGRHINVVHTEYFDRFEHLKDHCISSFEEMYGSLTETAKEEMAEVIAKSDAEKAIAESGPEILQLHDLKPGETVPGGGEALPGPGVGRLAAVGAAATEA